VSADLVEVEINEALEKIASLPKKVGGDPTERFGYIDQMIQALKPTPLIAQLAEIFQQEKKARSMVDYSDQVALAYKAVSEFDQLAADLRASYSQVLLDEYQDTSVLQTKLLSKTFGAGSVFAVGDPNQSIYGWRGASASNLDEFEKDFGKASIFSLATSWRNPVNVLEKANLIAKPLANQASFELPKHGSQRVLPVTLVPKPDAETGSVEIRFSQTIEQEANELAHWLKPKLDSGASCAVLMRKRSSMGLVVDVLQQAGIEVEVVGLGGLLELPEIVDLVSALCVIQRADSGAQLIRLLAGPRWRIGVKDIDRLFVVGRKLSGPRQEGIFSQDLSLVEALEATLSPGLDLFDVFSADCLNRLREAATLFRNLRSATALPLADYVRVVAEELWLDIELRANPKLKNPLAQLASFYEIVAGFSTNSAAFSLGTVLNWLDYAAKRERFEIPRSNPGKGVVQVLTVHAAKGLEWDYVAIPNLVEDDFPARSRNSTGWLASAELPFPLRGDSASLPVFDYNGPKIQSEIKKSADAFKADNREHQLREEYRLIYVAITRAKKELLLTGSYWKPGNLQPRKPSRFLEQIAAEEFEFSELESEVNPLDLAPKTKSWPLEPVGEKQALVLAESANQVRQASSKLSRINKEDLSGSLIHEEIDLLLKEQDDRIANLSVVLLPVRIPASRFKEFIKDVSGLAAKYQRPVPTKPYLATRTGTLFHSWVEDFLLSEIDQLDSISVIELSEIFKNSRFAALEPVDVEIEINLTEGVNTFVCKLDAVFKSGERYEIVDWKTGAVPKTQEEIDLMSLQLALYRLAYSRLRAIPIEQIDVCFYFVSDNTELRPKTVPSGEELMNSWRALFV
jgi:DNA helicase-2/ATP-dependent DNA helicase PcrA